MQWKYEIVKIYRTPGKAAVQVRFSCGDEFFYKTFVFENAGQLESIDFACRDEIARVEELYKKVDELNKKINERK